MADPMYALIGSLIRRHRDQVGMTQAQLAVQVGLSRTSITNIERGRQPLLVHQLCQITERLGVGMKDFIGDVLADRVSAATDHPPEFLALLGKLDTTSEAK
ncbi:MAG: helix-turn-helix domain-containing protein [Janthinobacterium lividum]